MIAGWSILPFSDVVADETGGNIKTLQSEFLSEGAYPIVDQGKELVAGFTDDPARLCKAEMPAIIFGDHTKCLKFIDFPFCLGADGTKVLRPIIDGRGGVAWAGSRPTRLGRGSGLHTRGTGIRLASLALFCRFLHRILLSRGVRSGPPEQSGRTGGK